MLRSESWLDLSIVASKTTDVQRYLQPLSAAEADACHPTASTLRQPLVDLLLAIPHIVVLTVLAVVLAFAWVCAALQINDRRDGRALNGSLSEASPYPPAAPQPQALVRWSRTSMVPWSSVCTKPKLGLPIPSLAKTTGTCPLTVKVTQRTNGGYEGARQLPCGGRSCWA